MKRSKFSKAQIDFVLKHTEDGTGVGKVCRKTRISEATFYAWYHTQFPVRAPNTRLAYG